MALLVVITSAGGERMGSIESESTFHVKQCLGLIQTLLGIWSIKNSFYSSGLFLFSGALCSSSSARWHLALERAAGLCALLCWLLSTLIEV